MKSILVRLGAVALLTFGLNPLRAQLPSGDYGSGPGMPTPILNASTPLKSSPHPSPSLSQWIVGTEPDCCGPISGETPIMTELYFRSGVSFPFGDGQLEKAVHAGWTIGGGARALCFDSGSRAAWTFDLGITNTYNGSADSAVPVTLLNVEINGGQQFGRVIVPSLQATPSAFNRIFVNLGVGREYYLFGAANGTRDDEDGCWRVGFDGGGRYGSSRVLFREIQHLTDVIGGAYLSFHSDYEVSLGCCTCIAGIRTELDYTWSDILQEQNKSDLWGLNLLFNVGVRF